MNEILNQYGLHCNLNLETLSFTDEADWLRLRTVGIGGSDIGAIMGINKYSSPYQVYKQKVLGEHKDLSSKVVVKKGKDLESLIRSMYVIPHFKELGYTVKNLSHHMIINKEYPFLRANLDGIGIKDDDSDNYKEHIVIEIKFVSEYAEVNWNGEDYCGVPASYYAQVQEYMLVTGMETAYVCALFEKDWIVRFYKIRKETPFQAKLLKAASHFYEINMMNKIPPAFVVGIDDVEIREEVKKPKEFIKDDSLNETVAEYLNAVFEIKEKTKVKDKLQSEIVDAYTKGRVPSSPLHFVNITTYTTSRLDTARLKEEKPEIYEQYLKESETSKTIIK